MRKKIKIELQYFEGCPNSDLLKSNTRKAVNYFEEFIDYKERLITSSKEASRIKFRGSPTLLINNIDFENREEPQTGGLNCRVYFEGIPSIEQIMERIESVVIK